MAGPEDSQHHALDAAAERRLVEAARRGDRHAYGELVEAHRERLFAAAFALVRNEEDARDLSQDAFVKAYNALDRFDTARPWYPWLYRILRNACLNHLKKHGPHRTTSLDRMADEDHMQFEAAADDPVERIQTEQMARHMRQAIGQLKPDFREIILMKHFQEMTYEEIATVLDIPIGTVMSRLFHARKNLAKLMEPYRVGS
ncbi:MAG: sigma-70 family RNA polymerase sigma factor [Candidatus Sumerlaeia bacterium]|nr:sigma-70 family RNA polymerase sigma factor [Candidatus Sumerlaeia bacterium]